MIKKFFSILLIVVSLCLASFIFTSCGDDVVGTHCLTNSTHFCSGPVQPSYFSVSAIIKEECKNDLSLGEKQTVFDKVYYNVVFPKPYNECIIDLTKIKHADETNATSVLLHIPEYNVEVTKDEFLNSQIMGSISDLEIRQYTNLKGFIKQEYWSGIELGTKVTEEGKEWLSVNFPKDIKECYFSFPEEIVPTAISNFGGSYMGIRIDNEAPTVASVEELLNLNYTKSIEISHLHN